MESLTLKNIFQNNMSVHGFRYQMFNSKDVGPSIEAGYGPYTSINQAIETILSIFRDDSEAEAYTTTGYAPPLGLHFGVIDDNNVFTEYEYKSGAFAINNVGEGIVPVGSGGSGTITDVVKGKSTDNQPPTLVTGTVAYIPMAEPQVNGQGGTDGLMSASDKSKLDSLIEVLEPGIYNSDESFEVQGQGSADLTALQGQVARIINILGSLYDSNGNDAHFEITE